MLTTKLLQEFREKFIEEDRDCFDMPSEYISGDVKEVTQFLSDCIDKVEKETAEKIHENWEVAIRFSQHEDESILSAEVMENHLTMSKNELKSQKGDR